MEVEGQLVSREGGLPEEGSQEVIRPIDVQQQLRRLRCHDSFSTVRWTDGRPATRNDRGVIQLLLTRGICMRQAEGRGPSTKYRVCRMSYAVCPMPRAQMPSRGARRNEGKQGRATTLSRNSSL